MKQNANVSLQVLLLNDLFRLNIIDKTIYDKALQELTALMNTVQDSQKHVELAAA